MRQSAYLFSRFLQSICKIASSLYGLPLSLWERLPRCSGRRHHDTHDDSRGKYAIEVNFRWILVNTQMSGIGQ